MCCVQLVINMQYLLFLNIKENLKKLGLRKTHIQNLQLQIMLCFRSKQDYVYMCYITQISYKILT